MFRTNRTRYSILGYLVWQIGGWYLRRRVRAARAGLGAALAAAATLRWAIALGKRLSG